MISAFYASILAGLMIWLAFQVIKQRRSAKVAYADGGVSALQVARSAHSNAVDYVPITLILLMLVEYNGASPWMIHAVAMLFVMGRLIHAKAILAESLKGRVKGMKLTFLSMVLLMALNMFYLPYDKFWSLT
ncbi:membrane protein [Vibrio zhanjiangensis]|uniref:Membrane protein n=1 Tax=Vibrio zhanjiangensis TaxID=1046128 RepID=A0ABQ6EUV5_9VIBR|nr:MAPEG family protein [Vibrio zhanjiangensis]GLT16851.1 membrane protein [Vibrio zhanjiangensis]